MKILFHCFIVSLLLFTPCLADWGEIRPNKWGEIEKQLNPTWEVLMLRSYQRLHGDMPSGAEDELWNRLQPGEYLYTTFGPDGQNKKRCDFVIAFKFTGNLSEKEWVKTGDTLRWDADGTVYDDSNNLPAHEIGEGDGILTVSTTDGWGGVTEIHIGLGILTGVMPNLRTAGFDFLESINLANAGFSATFDRFPSSLTFMNARESNLSDDVANACHLINMVKWHAGKAWTSKVYGNLNLPISCMPDIEVINFDYNPDVYLDLEVFEGRSNVTYIGMRSNTHTGGDIYHLRDNLDMTHIGLNGFLGGMCGDASHLSNMTDMNFIALASAYIVLDMSDVEDMVNMLNFNVEDYGSGNMTGNTACVVNWTHKQYFECAGTYIEVDIAHFANEDDLRVINCHHTSAVGDLADLSTCPNLIECQVHGCTGITVTDRFVNPGLRWTKCRDCDFNQTEIDQILHDWKLLVVDEAEPFTTNNYIIWLDGVNAVPSATGLTDKAAIEAAAATQEKSMTIEVAE